MRPPERGQVFQKNRHEYIGEDEGKEDEEEEDGEAEGCLWILAVSRSKQGGTEMADLNDASVFLSLEEEEEGRGSGGVFMGPPKNDWK